MQEAYNSRDSSAQNLNQEAFHGGDNHSLNQLCERYESTRDLNALHLLPWFRRIVDCNNSQALD